MDDTGLKYFHDTNRARRWQKIRKRIRHAGKTERLNFLRYFSDQIRAFMPSIARAATVAPEDISRALEVAAMHGAVIGAWLSLDPANPFWPGRDRLFVIRHDDLISTCSALATLGFFPPENVAELIEQVDAEGRRAVVPGIESPGAPTQEIADLMRESAIESARSKRRWRERLTETDLAWAEPSWRESPAVWRTCGIFDVADPVAAQCRDIPGRCGETPAGLVALVKIPQDETITHAREWSAHGWKTAIVNRDDPLNLYETLVAATMHTPLAIMIAIGQGAGAPHISRTAIRRKESGLLGEMSDEQFNELMGEALKF